MKKKRGADSITTFLGPNGSIEGVIEFKNTIRLDGSVKGKVFSSAGTVIVGEQAVIDAEIVVDVAIIMGRVNGTITARKRIEVYPPARVAGEMHAPEVVIESGVVFNGNCSMPGPFGAPEKVPEPVALGVKPFVEKALRAK